MWWKIFYWSNIVLAVIFIIGLAAGNNSLMLLILVADYFVAIIGLHAFIYRKKIFNSKFWYYFFWINLIIDIAYLFYGLAPNDPILRNLSFLNPTSGDSAPWEAIVGGLLNIPFLYAIYKLGKAKK